jgi:hypothetical protein
MNPQAPHQERFSGERPFIPHGVDANSWLGFEQRIQERRFHALVATARGAIAAGDREAAQDALEEARSLRPYAAELDELDSLEQQTISAPPPVEEERRRAGGAVALLAVGIALLLAVDAFRYPTVAPVAPTTPAAVLAIEPPVAVATMGALDEVPPPAELRRAVIEESAPAPPAPITRERTPAAPPAVNVDRTPSMSTNVAPTPAISRNVPPPPVISRNVAPMASMSRDTAREVTMPLIVPTAPAPVEIAAAPAPAMATKPAIVPAALAAEPADESLVAATLQRYAMAYTQLDARAARTVWPSVDERALSNAFAGLSAQSLDFQDCEVVVRQVEADAVCRGTASYVTRVGNSNPRVEPRTWHFELSRHGDRWLIDTAVARR